MNKRFAKIYINTPNKNVVTQRYVTPSGLHIHTKWEIMILEKGTIYNQVNDYAFTDTHPGDVFIMGPSHRHILEITGEPHAHWDIYCDTDTMKRICACFTDKLYEKLCKDHVSFSLDYNQLSSVTKDLEKLSKLNSVINAETEEDTACQTIANGLIHYLLSIYMMQSMETKISVPTWLVDFVYEIKKPENFSKRANEIAKFSNYSYSQLSKIFKKTFGINLITFLTEVRLEYASTLLRDTDLSILTVASELGYSNPSIFTAKFKNKFECSPARYRKLHRAETEAKGLPPNRIR